MVKADDAADGERVTIESLITAYTTELSEMLPDPEARFWLGVIEEGHLEWEDMQFKELMGLVDGNWVPIE